MFDWRSVEVPNTSQYFVSGDAPHLEPVDVSRTSPFRTIEYLFFLDKIEYVIKGLLLLKNDFMKKS